MPRTLVLSTALLLCVAGAAAARGIDVDKVNGSIRIDSGQQAGNLTTVNGSIRVADGASADRTTTVNGSIEFGARTTIEAIETVNGSVTLGDEAKVARTVEAVNGSIRLGKGADVAGHVSNVNGRIALDAAHVGGGIETVSGDIEIGADSRVEGGLLVDKPSGWSWGKSRNPRVVIGPRAVVTGTLEFRRDVNLYVSDSAKIDKVVGATPQKFPGEQP
ncbi:MAG: hypothetical protein GXC76_14530 [Rhodanobacteraceae bacterium]|jgi:predicted acyltransferase (DUF342 family)|nr:hypothetical protein [Rhodanobacteraceae bacterium]